jgi:prolyl oligopeptidase
VKAENTKTLAVLEKDPHYAGLYKDALTVAEARERIPTPKFLAGEVYNFWQDADHVRGIWRKTTVEDYRAAAPHWITVLDLDALAATEKVNWVWEDAYCLRPDEARCLLFLSDGGGDAHTVREFDLAKREFVKDGFNLPSGKQNVYWLDQNRLLVARDWGPGTMSAAGYPLVLKIVKRGEPLAPAQELFRGQPQDFIVDVTELADGSGHRFPVIVRGVSFFEFEYYLVGPKGPVKIALPLKCELEGLVENRLIVKLDQAWSAGGKSFETGALIAVDMDAAQKDAAALTPALVYQPSGRESFGEVMVTTRSKLLLTLYHNVDGRALVFSPDPGNGWSHRTLDLPDQSSIDMVSADWRSDRAFLEVAGFLTPTSLWMVDGSQAPAAVKSLPAQFDASTSVVEQHEATSKDGTKIPYFLVHPRNMKLDRQTPTLLYAYGGFQISMTPEYSGTIGKLWLEHGGAYVLANIRGGGEFGPAWHEAGLKTHRQRIYDDFAAVAEDLIATGVTSQRRLGIQGASNGGLLMGVEFTQHPELWNAVNIGVPLLDMLRFEHIDAGSSWVGEYGSVSVPTERAFLASISPYNNLKQGVHYPLPLLTTSSLDDRVGPQHARKFAAKLSAMGIPYLFYEETEGGHSLEANLKNKARTEALIMTYFTRQLMTQP